MHRRTLIELEGRLRTINILNRLLQLGGIFPITNMFGGEVSGEVHD